MIFIKKGEKEAKGEGNWWSLRQKETRHPSRLAYFSAEV